MRTMIFKGILWIFKRLYLLYSNILITVVSEMPEWIYFIYRQNNHLQKEPDKASLKYCIEVFFQNIPDKFTEKVTWLSNVFQRTSL